MIKRRKTRIVNVGGVEIGSSSPIAIQSMTKVGTTDVGRCVRQVGSLVQAGCSLVRIAVPTPADTKAFAKIVKKFDVPLIADVHFSVDRAVEAIECGAAKIRINPGNIKGRRDIFRIIDAAQRHGTAIRIGVNEASIRDLKAGDVAAGKRVALMLREIKKYVGLFEKRGFTAIVLSAKSSDAVRTIEINRRLAEEFDYPLHVGLTHAGLPADARIPSAVTLGALLAEGIGDTVRVSAAGDPVQEVEIAKEILSSLGLYELQKPELIVCPTCGRAEIDVIKLARQVKRVLEGVDKPMRVAVMGCIVNGPGESADADLAVCAGKDKAYLYSRGKRIKIVDAEDIIPAITELAERF